MGTKTKPIIAHPEAADSPRCPGCQQPAMFDAGLCPACIQRAAFEATTSRADAPEGRTP